MDDYENQREIREDIIRSVLEEFEVDIAILPTFKQLKSD
jgi:hypothetical protein